MEKGRLHMYTGDGKGKTTAGIGLAVRFFGSGGQVLFVQFMKGIKSSEVNPLRQLGIEVLQDSSTQKFVFQMTQQEKKAYIKTQHTLLERARQFLTSGDRRTRKLLVLDEVCSAVETGILKAEEVAELLDLSPQTELVMTGRNPTQELLQRADYVSEICMRKHPFQTEGAAAREGIEF